LIRINPRREDGSTVIRNPVRYCFAFWVRGRSLFAVGNQAQRQDGSTASRP
jgi:hypothetical protein